MKCCFWIYIFFWISFSVYYKKGLDATFRFYYRSLFISSAFTLFFLVLVVSLTDLKIISRLFLISIIAVPSIIELLAVGVFLLWRSKTGKLEDDKGETRDFTETSSLRLKWVVVGFALLMVAFFLMVKIEYGVLSYHHYNENIFIILLSRTMQ